MKPFDSAHGTGASSGNPGSGVAVDLITTIDLFAGAGGLSLGFHMADLGYRPVYAVEHDHAAASTFKSNFDCDVFGSDIEDGPMYPTADVIVGGPPCQGFSPLGRDRDAESRACMNDLWEHYLDAVAKVRPRAFVIENVPEFQRSSQFARLLDLMATDPLLSRYAIGYGVLNAADYGVAQTRRRGILVAALDAGHRDERGHLRLPWPPPPSHGPNSEPLSAYRTVRDVIGDLPRRTRGTEPYVAEDGSQYLHFGRRPRPSSLERYKAIPPGGNRFDLQRNRPDLTPRCWVRKPTGTTDVMGRLWWERPSTTIRTEFFKPEKGRYLHPSANRVISHREAARIQSFPDSYVFEGSKTEIARQIGNAVPPLLGRAIARYVHAHAFAPGGGG